MNRFKAPAALLAVAVLAMACSEGTGPGETTLEPGVSFSHPDHPAAGFTDVSGDVTTVPPDAEVWRKQVNFANNLSGCDVFGIESDFGGKIDENTGGTYEVDGIEVTLENLGGNSWAVSVEAGYILTDVFLKQGGNPGDINQWYHFVPGVSSASGLVTIDNALSHLSVCINDAPVVELQNLNIEKTAEASFTRTFEWDLEKLVNGEESVSFSGGPGDVFNWTWWFKATLTETVGDYKVEGEITITNPNPVPVQVDVDDVLDDGTVADVTCPMVGGEIWVPAHDGTDDGELVCTYEAFPEDDAATFNRVDVEVLDYDPPAFWDGVTTIEGGFATADIEEWVETIEGDEEVTLEDLYLEYEEDISETTEESFPESYTCSSDVEDYEDGFYEKTIVNVATLTGDNTDLEESATVEILCALVWEGESATASSAQWPDTRNWFHYADASENHQDIVYGRKLTPIGTITFNPDNGTTEICFALDAEARLADVDGNVKIHPMSAVPTEYVAPGQYSHHFTNPENNCVTVPTEPYYGIHLDIEVLVLP